MTNSENPAIEKLSGVSSQAVLKATGKTWDEWLTILDAAGAQKMQHPDIARLLSDEHGVPDWWCQMVTVGYEQARGMREVHEKPDGFTANASKTLAVPLEALFNAWNDEVSRSRWLPDAPMSIRKITPNKSMRIEWPGDTNVDVNFYAKGPAKSQVALQHSRLPDADASAEMKAYWKQALNQLSAFLS